MIAAQCGKLELHCRDLADRKAAGKKGRVMSAAPGSVGAADKGQRWVVAGVVAALLGVVAAIWGPDMKNAFDEELYNFGLEGKTFHLRPDSVPFGVDTGIRLAPHKVVHIVASGEATYGYDVTPSCVGQVFTDPDGNRFLRPGDFARIDAYKTRELPCAEKKFDTNMPLNTAPVGALLAQVGSGPLKLVGKSGEVSSDAGGELTIAYNDSTPTDNISGSFDVTVTNR